MNTIESGHFLLTAVNSAEDVSLLTESYNICTTDDVLRNAVVIDHKPLVIFGPVKRHNMCKKKLPQKFKELNLEYKESEINFVTEDTLKLFVAETLERLKAGVAATKEILISEGVEELLIEEDEPEEISQPEVIVELAECEQAPSLEVPLVEEVQIEPVKSEPIMESALCKYGVPKFKVEYLTPNTIGLKESLFVNVSDDDISKFFESVKSRVLASIEK